MAITNGIPDRLHDMRTYIGKKSKISAGIATVTLPDLAYLTDTLKGAAVGGELETIAPGLLKAMDLSLDYHTVTDDVFELSKPKSHYIDCRSVVNVVDGADGSPKSEGWRVVAVGTPKTTKVGKVEPNSTMGTNVNLSISSYQVYHGGKELVYIDVLNYICRIGGVDFLAEARALMGL